MSWIETHQYDPYGMTEGGRMVRPDAEKMVVLTAALPVSCCAAIRQLSKEHGLPMAEVVRRALQFAVSELSLRGAADGDL